MQFFSGWTMWKNNVNDHHDGAQGDHYAIPVSHLSTRGSILIYCSMG